MMFPEKLKKGDTVGLVCTGSPIKADEIKKCIKAVERMGYKVKASDNLSISYGGYMAGDGRLRAKQINEMFKDREVAAIFCVRGGYGSNRIMEHIDYEAVRDNPKIFVGYSDVTNLHSAFNQKCDLITFHGPMVYSDMIDGLDPASESSLFKAINASSEIIFQNPEGLDVMTMKEGKGSGRLAGGNLSLLSAGIGTPYEIDTEGKILFMEETCEPMGKIEKWAWHLRDAGKLKGCNGIILGQFTDIYNKEAPEYDEIACFSDVLENIDVPVLYNVQSGHGKPMMTLPMGALCTISSTPASIKFNVRE